MLFSFLTRISNQLQPYCTHLFFIMKIKSQLIIGILLRVNIITLSIFCCLQGLIANNSPYFSDEFELLTLFDKSLANENLPAIISDPMANRGAGFNGEYVFVASRQEGNQVYVWDVNDYDTPVSTLDMTGVDGGVFAISDLTVAGDNIFASNMVFSGNFKVYRWQGIAAQAEVFLEYDSPARLGDAFTIIGNPHTNALLVASAHGTKSFYIWNIQDGTIADAGNPLIIHFDQLDGQVNFARITQVPEENYYLMSGSMLGVTLLNNSFEVVAYIPASFFPAWSMYPTIFYHNGSRYLAYVHVTFDGENAFKVLDISQGNDIAEAIELLAQSSFNQQLLFSIDLGSAINGNASVSLDIIQNNNNALVMAYSAGNGFTVKTAAGVADFDITGDANCDGVVNVLDVIAISNYFFGLQPEPFCFHNADIDGNGIINVLDIIGTVEIYVGEVQPDAVEDADGNVYAVSWIGDRLWMNENLRTARYSDGSLIPGYLSNTEWQNTTLGAYDIYPHDDVNGIDSDQEMITAYGKLYNWYSVDDPRGLCPEGWEVASAADWEELIAVVSATNGHATGNRLKSCLQVDSPLEGDCATFLHPRWDADETHFGTDDLGFSALPAGVRLPGGQHEGIGTSGSFWVMHDDSLTAVTRRLFASEGSFNQFEIAKNAGVSIRCIKETAPPVSFPVIQTHDVSEITSTTAVSGGLITNDGGGLITQRGIVWSQSENPTLTNNLGYTFDGLGSGSFITVMVNLTPNTEYYVRAYAVNQAGTAYGEQHVFTTGAANTELLSVNFPDLFLEGDIIENNVYVDVGFGTQLEEVLITFDISPFATVSPPSGSYVDLSCPLEIIVTSETGEENIYTLYANVLEQETGVRALWIPDPVHSPFLSSYENMQQGVALAKELNFNVLYVVAWARTKTLFPSEVLAANSTYNTARQGMFTPGYSGTGDDPLADLVELAHNEGLKVVLWFEYGFMARWGSPPTPANDKILAVHPHWVGINNQGEAANYNNTDFYYNAYNPEVQQFMIDLVMEAVNNYNIDGIQGDDRMPAMPRNSGYDEYTVNRYKDEHNGQQPPGNPNNIHWVQWRADILNEFWQNMYNTVKGASDDLLVTSAPNPYPWSFVNLMQQWPAWLDAGKVDIFSVQCYRYTLASYKSTLNQVLYYFNNHGEGNLQILSPGIILLSQAGHTDPGLLLQKIRHNRSVGITGESFFYDVALNNDDIKKVIKAMYPGPALFPDL